MATNFRTGDPVWVALSAVKAAIAESAPAEYEPMYVRGDAVLGIFDNAGSYGSADGQVWAEVQFGFRWADEEKYDSAEHIEVPGNAVRRLATTEEVQQVGARLRTVLY